MKTRSSRPRLLLCAALSFCSSTLPARAQTDAAPPAVPGEVFEVLSLVQAAADHAYSVAEVERLFRAVWWDVTYDQNEERLMKLLNGATRPVAIAGPEGRTLSFTKTAAPDAMRQQRFLLPGNFSPNDSTYFVHAFANTKYAGVFIGACRVHENAANIMETSLNDMINQARFQTKTAGEDMVVKLFTELEAGYRAANPAIQGEFADIVRRAVARYSSDPKVLPESVRTAAWLRPPS